RKVRCEVLARYTFSLFIRSDRPWRQETGEFRSSCSTSITARLAIRPGCFMRRDFYRRYVSGAKCRRPNFALFSGGLTSDMVWWHSTRIVCRRAVDIVDQLLLQGTAIPISIRCSGYSTYGRIPFYSVADLLMEHCAQMWRESIGRS